MYSLLALCKFSERLPSERAHTAQLTVGGGGALLCLQKENDMCAFHTSQASWLGHVQDAPVFKPTSEQFKDPLAYIQSIQAEAAKYGEYHDVLVLAGSFCAVVALKPGL